MSLPAYSQVHPDISNPQCPAENSGVQVLCHPVVAHAPPHQSRERDDFNCIPKNIPKVAQNGFSVYITPRTQHFSFFPPFSTLISGVFCVRVCVCGYLYCYYFPHFHLMECTFATCDTCSSTSNDLFLLRCFCFGQKLPPQRCRFLIE